VDREKLPALDTTRVVNDGATYVAPRSTTEQAIVSIWEDLIGVKPIGATDDFFALGGHSLLSVQLLARIREHHGVDIPLRALFEEPTVEGLSRRVEIMQSGRELRDPITSEDDLSRDVILDPAIRPIESGNVHPGTDDPVLLTGATGFVGAFLLRELLLRTNADVHCLVRAATDADARNRLERALVAYGISEDRFAQRIVPVRGDLALPRFGLAEAEFDALASRVSTIYHNGAEVHFVYPYEKLRAPNVLGTLEVIRLACLKKTKPIHYVSTVAVFAGKNSSRENTIREDDEPTQVGRNESGYAQSKYVAEKLVVEARNRGVPVSIYRPAWVSGHSVSGASTTGDLFNRVLKSCVQLKCAPLVDFSLDFVPVDYVASALVRLSLQEKQWNKTFHLVGRQRISWLEAIGSLQRAGFAMSAVAYHCLLQRYPFQIH
jgi:thioester reductase-like protein